MAVSFVGLRTESGRLRAMGWSYRRIALEWQHRYGLNARVAFRLAHGWTQEEAARRWNERWSADAPKTGKSFSYWEIWPDRGGRPPSTRTLQRLAELYLCRPGDLLDGEDFSRLDTGSDDISVPLRSCSEPGAADGWPSGGAVTPTVRRVRCACAMYLDDDGDDGGDGRIHGRGDPLRDKELAVRRLSTALTPRPVTERFRVWRMLHNTCDRGTGPDDDRPDDRLYQHPA